MVVSTMIKRNQTFGQVVLVVLVGSLKKEESITKIIYGAIKHTLKSYISVG